MTSVGETLRRERLRRNLDLEQISRETKISPKMLAAIEAEQFERLPGGVFAKSFVRQYARLLGLDEEEIVAELERVIGIPEPELPVAGAKQPAPEIKVAPMAEWESVGSDRGGTGSWLPALALVVIVMLVCSAVYAWWQRSRRPAPPRETTTTAQQSPAPTLPASTPATAPPLPPRAATPEDANPAAPTAPGSAATTSPATENAPAHVPATAEASRTDTTASQQPPTSDATAAGNPNAPVRVQLTAEQPTWIRVASDGKYVFSGTLEANQSRTVEANNAVRLRLGNAGGVGIVLNGKALGPVGPKGQVLELQLTPGGFEIVPRKAASPVTPPMDPL